MKHIFTITFIGLAATALLLMASCGGLGTGKPDCGNATGDLSMQALERATNTAATVGDTFTIRCVIKNVAAQDVDCSTDVPAAVGTMKVGYSPVNSGNFGDFTVFAAGQFDIKPLQPTGVQQDLVPIVPDKKGWYAVQIDLNTGATPVKEITASNNSRAVSFEVK